MHARRLSTFILGLWIAATLFMYAVATQNFRGVERVLEAPAPGAAKLINGLGRDNARHLLRYQVSELNRHYFGRWELIQIALGLLLAGALIFAAGSRGVNVLLAALMIGIVLLERFLLTPEMTFLGRQIDFLPLGEASSERARFWNFHAAYSTAEVLKLLAAGALSARLLVRGDRRRRRVEQVDAVDHADHGHVNR